MNARECSRRETTGLRCGISRRAENRCAKSAQRLLVSWLHSRNVAATITSLVGKNTTVSKENSFGEIASSKNSRITSGPKSHNLPGLGSGHRICTYVYREFEKRNLAWCGVEFFKNQRSKFFYFCGLAGSCR